MTVTVCGRVVAGAVVAMAAVVLVGCGPVEYHGHQSGIDGVLWRQIAAFEDPLSMQFYEWSADEPASYLAALEGARWNGDAATASELGIEDGGVVFYDIAPTELAAEFSVFIASGPRPDAPTDQGHPYTGPSEVYICYVRSVSFDPYLPPSAGRELLDECPPALVGLLAEDAAFASGEVFDG